ncbi:putative pteridine transporter [Novymonas esmeraldas]|uniref:Pteridine transporter n=1 Tax=Novymonas esmeraldas TaxID=1808958 RepID=A0AAW0F7P6_9TRYP
MAQPHYTPNNLPDEEQGGLNRAEAAELTVPLTHDGTAGAVEYVHPEAVSFFAACPWTKHIPLFTQSCKGFGPRGTVSLAACYFFNKGLGNYIVNFSRYAMFRDRFGIDGTRYQRLSTLRTMGWSVKAFSACISDTFALFGYTKRWYCAGSCVAGGAFALAFGLLPAKESSANMGAGFMFLTSFCMANVDILSEGHYSRILRKRPEAGPALVSWIWVFIFIASLLSAAIQGPLSDKKIPQVGLFISAAAQTIAVFFFIFNWYGERFNRIERYEDVLVAAETERQRRLAGTGSDSENSLGAEPDLAAKDLHPEAGGVQLERKGDADFTAEKYGTNAVALADTAEVEEEDMDHSAYIKTLCGGAVEVNKEVFLRNWRLYIYSTVMVSAIVAQCIVTVYGKSHDLAWSSIAVAVSCCGTAFWACNLVTAKAICFVFLDMLLYVQLPGVMDSFYMAPKSCLPDGPHFTYVFYNTVATIIGDIGGIAGVICFSYIFSQRSYWFTFIVTTIIKVLGSVFDIILVKRWNLAIGIPDHAMYIMGDAIVYEVCSQLAWMPLVLLFSRICPRGSESIIYALGAGFSNMGQSMSNTIGSLMIETRWPVKTKGTCDFSNAPMLLLVAHILLPLAVIPLSILLLPRARICDDIDPDGNAVRKDKKKEAAAAPQTGDAPLDDLAGFQEPVYNREREGKR